jgi:DNA topoisomerase-1
MISPTENDKVQAYGFDTKGRKQIIYAKWFTEDQNRAKFDRVMKLEKTIKKVEDHISKTLKSFKSQERTATMSRQMSRQRKIEVCTIVKLMMLCNFRIGSAVNATKYKSYGLTTIEWRHVKISKTKSEHTIKFSFIGKKGVLNEAVCHDRHIYKILSNMYDDVRTDDTVRQKTRVFSVSSADVNSYLRSFDENITSKDIRTWQANVLFVKYFMANSENAKTNEKIMKYNCIIF